MSVILIIGQNGQVSQYLQDELNNDFELHVSTRQELDLTQTAAIQAYLEALAPSVIINPAAYTAVDSAEQETELAFKINRDAVREIARYSAKTSTPLIHYSTDYVFDGQSKEPYTEDDTAKPNGVYGQSKFEGEQAVIESGAPAIILRTAWVYSNKGKNFYKTMLSLSESRNELSVVNDQFGSPTYAGSIACATKDILKTIVQQGQLKPSQIGVFHFTCQGVASWCEFAQKIFEVNGCDQMHVSGIPSSEYPTPVKRPVFSALNGDKLHSTFNVRLPEWQDALNDCATQSKRLNALT